MKHVVIDTNIFISALTGKHNASRHVIRLCLSGAIQPLMGVALFAEYEDVIHRKEIISLSPIGVSEIESLCDAFMRVCRWVSVYYLWRPNLKDEADNHLMELAIAGNAEIIITNNIKDFQNSELLFPAIAILKPEDFLMRVTSCQH
jgi:putative PIN family toxin of toxin-antitoxin system